MMRFHRCLVAIACLAATAAGCMPPSWGAAALLHPARHTASRQPTLPFETFAWQGAGTPGVKLVGWWFHAGSPRGTLIYLHGVADNRGSSVGIAEHFVPLGFDVVAYDSRAHETWRELDAWLATALLPRAGAVFNP